LGVYGQEKYSIATYDNTLWQAVIMAGKEVRAETKLTFSMLWTLVTNLSSRDKVKIQESVDQLSGPIGATKIGSQMIAIGWWQYLLIFAAMISLALAVFNILPIPALDGGRIVSVIIQRAWRIPKNKFATIEGYVNFFFFVILMLLWIMIMIKDYIQFRT
jgi:regulator of sigma E protease